jgi:IS30 family transposase
MSIMEKFSRLDCINRVQIDFLFNKEHKNYTEIANELGVSKNTIAREIDLGKVKCSWYIRTGKDIRYKLIKGRFIYQARYAQKQAEKRVLNSKKKIKLDNNDYLYSNVEHMLKNGRKPDVISGLLRECVNKHTYQNTISAECIYQYIYKNTENGFFEYLGIKKAKKKRKSHSKRLKYLKDPNRKRIHQRPKSADDRSEIGHFEMDLMVGSTTSSKRVILTVTDRRTRKNHARFCDNKSADEVYKKLKEIIAEIGGSKYVKSITTDNGTEFCKYNDLHNETGITTYFADAYCSWQKGTNERHNGLLRRFFPKKKNFDSYTDQDLIDAINFWNNYERKILKYYTPNELWDKEFKA